VLFERAAIVGVGLIGGSLALAARTAGLIGTTVGVGRGAANLATARARGLVDRTTDDFGAIGPVDLAVLAVPVRSIERVARELLPHLAPGTVLTDVGSVKGPIVAGLEALCPPSVPFVGTHPIAGSERGGAAAAEETLFRGARCVITPTPRTDPAALQRVEALWRGVGAVVERTSPEAHDRALAWTSHLVHVIAYALAHAIETVDPELFRYAGPSLRDATRVAASAPSLWSDILLTNADAVSDAAAVFDAELERFCSAVRRRDEAALAELLAAGHAARARLGGGKG
jgi:prephenate dehydrogenase